MRNRFWIAFIGILLFSAVLNQILLDTKAYYQLGKIQRNYVDVLAVAVTGILGIVYFYKPALPVFKILWIGTYIISLLFLLSITLLDNYVLHISRHDGQHRFGSLKEILINPFLFIILYVLEIILQKDKNIKKPSQ